MEIESPPKKTTFFKRNFCKETGLSQSTGRQRDEVISLLPFSFFSDNSMELRLRLEEGGVGCWAMGGPGRAQEEGYLPEQLAADDYWHGGGWTTGVGERYS